MTDVVTVAIEREPGTEWDAFVRQSGNSSHFHLAGWRRVMHSVFAHECVYFGARQADGRLVGVLPLVRVRSVVFGHFLVSMPFVNYGGPLGTPDATQALVLAAQDLARRSRASLLELRSRYPLAIDLPVSHRKITCVLDVPAGDPEGLFGSLPRKVRNKVRLPQKEGITVRFGADQLRPFFSVFSRHMRDLGTPTQSARLFEAIAREFGDDVWFGCAYAGERPIAGGCGFRWGTEFEMTWASALREFSPVAPNMLLFWAFMERTAREGLSAFNFGRCTLDSNTHRFKQQWGSRDEPLWWYQAAQGRTQATPSPHDAAYAWGPRIWRRLPVPIATALGPRIVRYIP